MTASKEELAAAMYRITDALRYMRGPTGELIYVGEKAIQMAWHLARAGCDVDPDRAFIKARPVPDRPGQFTGMIDWVPVDWPDRPEDANAKPVSALSPDVDLDQLDDAIPWHVKTKIEGNFQ